MLNDSIEISLRGKWTRVPALNVAGKTVVVTGRFVRVAAIHDEDWQESVLEDPEVCLRLLREDYGRALRGDIFTFSQKVSATVPKHPYHLEWDSIASFQLTSFKDWWEKLPQETRKNVRRSQKRGITLTLSELNDGLVREIMEVNNDSAIRQGRRFPHYGKSFDEVKRDYSDFLDRSDFISARFENELIGFLKLVYRGNVASVLQLLTKSRHYDKRPANALLAKAVDLCQAKGVTFLTYGKFHYGNKGGDSLAEFKIRNGFKEILVPRYYIPLTLWGSLCLKLRFHHRFLDIVPRRALGLGLASRAMWYEFKQSMSRRSSMAEQPNGNRLTERSTPPAGSNR